MHNSLVGEVSRSLHLGNGQSPIDLLPKLNRLECYGSSNARDAFVSFIDGRSNAGRPVTFVPFERPVFVRCNR